MNREKTQLIYDQIKNVEVEMSEMKMSVGQMDNNWISYKVCYKGMVCEVIRSYQRDHWIIYTSSEPNICISRNNNLNPNYPDLLPTNWVSRDSKKSLTVWNELIQKFNQAAAKIIDR